MKERGIIFNAEMVRAILDGRKTQTRRVIAPSMRTADTQFELHQQPDGSWVPMHTFNEGSFDKTGSERPIRCPFGAVGDRLWVRESYSLLGNEDGCAVDWDDNIVFDQKSAARIYRASCFQKPGNYGLWSIPGCDFEFDGRWIPSINMPCWASRITLEITGVRVERLNDISQEDAIAEGLERYNDDGIVYYGPFLRGDCRPEVEFGILWQSIYGAESWQANPWVWAITFKRLEAGQ